MKKNYSGTEILNLYNNKVIELFIDNNLAKFVQDLRNYFLHRGIKGFSYGFSMTGPNIGDVKFSTLLQKKI